VADDVEMLFIGGVMQRSLPELVEFIDVPPRAEQRSHAGQITGDGGEM
jgi:hypothetical protein